MGQWRNLRREPGANRVGAALLLLLVASHLAGWLVGRLNLDAEGLVKALAQLAMFLPPILYLGRGRAGAARGKPPVRRAAALLLLLFPAVVLVVNLLVSVIQRLMLGLFRLGAPEAARGVDTPAQWIWTLVTSVLLAPVLEETLFRGQIQPVLSGWGSGRGLLLTSVCFALIHSSLWELPSVFLLSLWIGWVMQQTGMLGLCMLMHAVNNVVAIFLIGRGGGAAALGWIVAAAAAALLFVAGLLLLLRGGLLRAADALAGKRPVRFGEAFAASPMFWLALGLLVVGFVWGQVT